MHKLDRNSVHIPACLVQGLRIYEELNRDEKGDIRQALLDMQHSRCAYCERRTGIERDDGHIEHFRDQANHTDLQSEWDNMFWSCNDEKTCGKHKDKCCRKGGDLREFKREDIINPSIEDPENLLVFVSDGTVRPRDGINELDIHRAEETIRIFSLNAPHLVKMRLDRVNPYKRFISVLMGTNPECIAAYIQQELNILDENSFPTVVKSFLTSI